MKKSLLFMVVIMLSAQARAGEFVYEYSGVADGFYGYSEYADKYRQAYKHNHTPVWAEFYSSAGYLFANDSALKLGVDLQISDGKEVEDYNQGEWGENVYLTYENGNFGEVSVGQIYNAAYQMAVGAPLVGTFRVNNSPITDFIANPNWQRHSRVASYRTLNSTYLNTDADAAKISYITPEFYNSKLAFSFAPNSYSQAGLVNKHSRYKNKSSYAAGFYNNTDFSWVEVESSLGYAYNHKNNQEVSAGLSLYRKGWTLGGSYRKSFTTGSDYAMNIRRAEDMPEGFDGFRRGQAYNIGISYEIGPFKTGLAYFAAYADKTDNHDDIVSWANKFAVNKYLSVYLTAAYAQYKGDGRQEDNNRGYATITGIELSF